jgi:ABC-2 type transport system permease protein
MKASPPGQTVTAGHLAKAARPARSAGFGLASLTALYTLTLRQHLHGRRWMIMAAVLLIPAFLAGLVRATATDPPLILLEFLFVFMLIPQALLPLVALFYGSGIIQDEQEEQTLTYLLIRPLPRWAIYAVKVLATLTTVVVLTSIFTALTYVVLYVGADAGEENIPLRCLKAIIVHDLAVSAYCCLFAVISLLTRWGLVAGFLYGAFFEGLIANLPFSIRWLTVIYHARVIAYRSMKFLLKEGQHTENLAADAWQFDIQADPNLLEHPSLATSVIVLLVGSLCATLLGAFLCSSREFHVKTPEGS